MRVDAEDPNGSRTVLPAFMRPSSLPGLIIPKRAFWSASQRCMKTPDSLFYLGFHCYSLSFVTCRFRLSVYSHSMALILPSRHSSCIQFSAASRSECRRMTRRRVSLASGTKVGTTSKTFSKLSSVEFSFLSQSARRAAIGGSLAPKTPVLKLNRPVSCKPPAAIVSESARAACTPFAKPQVADLRHRQAK